MKLKELRKFEEDKNVLLELAKIKKQNKERLANYLKEKNGIV